ncbi:MAG: hypothetical protein KVP17_004294 [Porospora cf. gigantea B]|uniref:uncharacterized protein n=1 Tax=Porospora cf. gigantea B TaxID=2853592 RepID=UPI003571E3D2|nr:MAG: hypothetical protein KVP17_004294 [Porospora cf. gigantea B]
MRCLTLGLTILSLGLTKATVVVAVRHGLQVLWSLILCWAVIGEAVGLIHWIGSALLAVGVVIIIVESDHHSHQLGRLGSWESVLYLAVSCAFCVVGGIVATTVPKKYLVDAAPRFLLSVSAGICGGLATVSNKLLVETAVAEVALLKDVSLQLLISRLQLFSQQICVRTARFSFTLHCQWDLRVCNLCR